MSRFEKGFTLLELIIALSITLVISASSGPAIFQVFGGTERNSNRLTAVRQVENAGFWIARDAQKANTVRTDNVTSPDLLLLNWTTWDDAGYPTYYSARYSFDNVTASIGRLKRNYWSSAGANQTALVALNIYYNPADTDNTTMASYQGPILTLRLSAIVGKSQETRKYYIQRRPNAY